MSVANTGNAELARVRAALPGYEVGGQIGRGGCGVVLAGVHRGLHRRVAIKQIPPQFAGDMQVRRRFVDEARMMAGLDHPHVVPVYDYIEHDDLCLLVLEYLPGGTVENRFITAGFEATAAVAVALSCAAGLDAAHRSGILHRDVKPSNLMFAANGALKLTDFGIAKIVGGADTLVTRAGEIIGTPSYIAPEQIRGQGLSPATDVYALATMLYQLLSGVLPFPPGPDALSLLFAHAYGDPIPLTEVAPFVPQPIAEAVMRGLASDPADRYDTAETFGVAIAEPAAYFWGANWLTPVGIPVIGADTIVAAATGSARGPRTPGPFTPQTPPPRPGLHDPYTPPPGAMAPPPGAVTLDSGSGPITPPPQPIRPHHPPNAPTADSVSREELRRTPGGSATPYGSPSSPSTGQGSAAPPLADPRSEPTRRADRGVPGPASHGGPAAPRGQGGAGMPAGHGLGSGPAGFAHGSGSRPGRGSGPGRASSPSGGPWPGGGFGPGATATMERIRPREPIRRGGARPAEVDRAELVPVQRVVTLPSPRVPLLAAALVVVVTGVAAVFGVGEPGRNVPPAGMIRIGGVDPASGVVDLDLSKPVPISVSGADADEAKLSVDVLGVRAGGQGAALPGGSGELSAPVNQYVLAGRLTGELSLSRAGSETAIYRFGVRTRQRATTTATAVGILLLLLFAAAYAESNARTLRRGSARFAATVGLAISTGLLGIAAAGAAWVLLGREPTLPGVVVCAAGGVAAGLALAVGCRRVGKRNRYLRVQLLRERA
ncbi:protein kinase domain-containing protein [Nocardia sp. CA-151230]|uniref:serine/threonine-protein kinase n=1 Tax=Nocardia sp. CA-151230 TaxID=3239982 RepID=UPI003D8FC2D9